MVNIPMVSVIIVCYNYGDFLPRALDAIARQTFRNFEVVFVDNGCTDNSAVVMKDFMDSHPDIVCNIVKVEKNIGYGHGNNVGSEAAQGEYMMFHDADDWMDDNCLELLVNAAKESDADRVIGGYRDVDENGKILRNVTFGKHSNHWICTNMQQANLLRTKIYKENHINVRGIWADNEKLMQFCGCTNRVVFVDIPCYNYLVQKKSEMHRRNIYNRIWDEQYSLDLLLKCFRNVYNSLEQIEDREWCEYESIRTYYIYICQYLLWAPLKIKWSEYPKLHSVMNNYFPNYFRNPKISFFRRNGESFRSRICVYIFSTAEKLHMMKALLLGLHLMSNLASKFGFY